MIDKTLLKIIVICSIITGAIIGAVSLIPAFMGIVVFVVSVLVSPFIIIYLKRLNVIKEIEIENSMIIGALSGASSFIGLSIIYFPIAFILCLIFKIQSYIWAKVVVQNFGFLIFMVVLISLLCALTNAFSGFLTAYIYSYFKKKTGG